MALTKVTHPTNTGSEVVPPPSLKLSIDRFTDSVLNFLDSQPIEVRCVRCGGKLEVPEDCPMPESILCGQCDWLEGR